MNARWSARGYSRRGSGTGGKGVARRGSIGCRSVGCLVRLRSPLGNDSWRGEVTALHQLWREINLRVAGAFVLNTAAAARLDRRRRTEVADRYLAGGQRHDW